MNVAWRTISTWRSGGRWTAVSALLVLLAVVTLPGCPRVGAAFTAGQDLRTVTENRPVVETFSTPGHYLLHGMTDAGTLCAACEEADLAAIEQQAAPLSVLTIDVTHRELTPAVAPPGAEALGSRFAATETTPTGHVARVPAPPPR